MPNITKPYNYNNGQTIDANQLDQNLDTLYNLINGLLDAVNIAANGLNDPNKFAAEVITQAKSKGLVYTQDLYGQSWVVSGGVTTASGSPANQITVTTLIANILQADGSYRHVSVAGTTYVTSIINATYFLELQPDGTMNWSQTHSVQSGFMPIATVTSDGSGNINVITDNRILDPAFTRANSKNTNGMTLQSIINANMEIWQTGTSFTNPANNTYTADMWVTLLSNTGTLPTTITDTQNTLTPGELFNSKYSYQINVNGAGSGFGVSDYYGKAQRIEFGTSKLCGANKKVTISFYAKSSIPTKRIAVGLKQVYGTGGSPSATEILTPTATTIKTLTSTMSLYTFTFTTNTLIGKTFGTNIDDYLEMCIYEMWGATFATNNLGGGTAETFVGSGNINFTQVVFNTGDQALPFQPKTFQQELLDCMRYLWMPIANLSYTRMIVYNANVMSFVFFLPTQMRTTPAIRGAANIDIQVGTTNLIIQTGFTFATTLLTTCVLINATKTAHGLTDGYISMSSSSGLDARL